MTLDPRFKLVRLGSAKRLTQACDLFGLLEPVDPTCRYLVG